VTPELHTGVAATPTGYKAWVVGLSPYTPAVGHWDVTYTFPNRDKAESWTGKMTRLVQHCAQQAGVTFKVRRWIDGAEQP
jgi:hypothetical protein